MITLSYNLPIRTLRKTREPQGALRNPKNPRHQKQAVGTRMAVVLVATASILECRASVRTGATGA